MSISAIQYHAFLNELEHIKLAAQFQQKLSKAKVPGLSREAVQRLIAKARQPIQPNLRGSSLLSKLKTSAWRVGPQDIETARRATLTPISKLLGKRPPTSASKASKELAGFKSLVERPGRTPAKVDWGQFAQR